MGIILIRYGELGLKSRPVRLRFEKTLLGNIENMFLREKVECFTSREWGRMMVMVKDDDRAGALLHRVMGITSFSPAQEISSGKEEIGAAAAERSKDALREGQSIAIRARRNGSHPYSSQELAAYVGGRVLAANRGLNLRVDLSNPDWELFIEVREKRAYLFADKFPGPGGLPLGTQGRVAVVLEDENSCAAAWLMMKRGCWPLFVAGGRRAQELFELMEPWATDMRLHTVDGTPLRAGATSGAPQDAGPAAGESRGEIAAMPDKPPSMVELTEFARRKRALAIVSGAAYAELQLNIPEADIPVIFPLVGMDNSEIKLLTDKVKAA